MRKTIVKRSSVVINMSGLGNGNIDDLERFCRDNPKADQFIKDLLNNPDKCLDDLRRNPEKYIDIPPQNQSSHSFNNQPNTTQLPPVGELSCGDEIKYCLEDTASCLFSRTTAWLLSYIFAALSFAASLTLFVLGAFGYSSGELKNDYKKGDCVNMRNAPEESSFPFKCFMSQAEADEVNASNTTQAGLYFGFGAVLFISSIVFARCIRRLE